MHPDHVARYLCVDEFLETLTQARTLKSGFELQVIDRLVSRRLSFAELEAEAPCPTRSLRLLLQLLVAHGVLVEDLDRFCLSKRFDNALRFRDLLEAKLDFALLVAPDFAEQFSVLLEDTQQFLSKARLFELIDYEKCLQATPENYQATRTWMRFTTALTRYEAVVCLSYHDFSSYQRLLDIGGNSGEFVRQICMRHENLSATVCDLPVVCDIGQQHLAGTDPADRISFFRANALQDQLPDGHDIITFKSMLHDWPDDQASIFLKKAHQALAPGGSLLVFERAPLGFQKSPLPFSLLPILMFFPFYRSPNFYVEAFEGMGMVDVQIQEFSLETPFFVVSAVKA